MSHKKINLRKQPTQERSRLMIEDILEAANLVLQKEGLSAFNTNRVAETAGVSIGSLYQYFPNKESLLFQLQEQETKTTWKALDLIFSDVSRSPRQRLESAIYSFFESEAEEFFLRCGLNDAEVDYEKTREYQELENIVIQKLSDFLSEILPSNSSDIESKSLLIFIVITSIGERVTQKQVDTETLQMWSKMCSDLLCDYLKI